MLKKIKIELPKSISFRLSKEVEAILYDYYSGSLEINEKILRLLLKIRSQKNLLFLIELFKTNFSSFEIIQKNLTEIETLLINGNLRDVKNWIRKNLDLYQKRIIRIFTQLKKYLKPEIKILTISNSKTIFDLLSLIYSNKYDPEVFVLMSLPGGEGKIFYEKLVSKKISSHLISDNDINKVLNKVDLVIVGADRILLGKWFINKIKTKKLLRLAKKKKKTSFLVSFEEKIMKDKKIDNTIVNDKKSKRVRFDKNLFERIDVRLVDEIFIA